MKLSTRLHTIFDMVQDNCIAADIGCDHGLLPIALIQAGKCSHVYACDVRKGPLSRAQEAIAQCGLQNAITTRLCDGLQGLGDDVEVVIIAGMGFDTICHILTQGMDKVEHYKQIILQCNSRMEDMRRWLHENGFTIDAEELVKDHHYYQLLSVHKAPCTMHEEQYLFGIHLDQHPLFKEYWTYILDKQKKIIAGTKPHHEGYAAAAGKIEKIEKMLKELD